MGFESACFLPCGDPFVAWSSSAPSVQFARVAAEMKFGPISIEHQLATLQAIGLRSSGYLMVDDLTLFECREPLEQKPYAGIFLALGYEIEREPFVPKCPSIWTCDLERIETSEDYLDVFLRLNLLVGNSLKVRSLEGEFDLDTGLAGVRFRLLDERYHWNLSVNEHAVDVTIFRRFDQLLADLNSEIRLYLSPVDEQGSVILIALSREQKFQVDRISGLEFVSCSS